MTTTYTPLVERYFTTPETHPFDVVTWEIKHVSFYRDGVKVEADVEAPDFWSDNAARIAADKYFGMTPDGIQETSVKQLITRVVNTVVEMGVDQEYFSGMPGPDANTIVYDEAEVETFRAEFTYILLHQYAMLNSPVLINFGAMNHKDESAACFVLGIEDSMDSIMDVAVQMANVYKSGAGVGLNISPLRSSKETLTGGGVPSGPISFLNIYNSIGDVVRSGGRARRAALLVAMDADHPDIESFITIKASEERKAHFMIEAARLIAAMTSELDNVDEALAALAARARETNSVALEGIASLLEAYKLEGIVSPASQDFSQGDGWTRFSENLAYSTVGFQNMNISVSVPNNFMKKVTGEDTDESWYLLARRSTNIVGYHTKKQTSQGELVLCDGSLYILKPRACGDYFAHEVLGEVSAPALFEMICASSHGCGDPGVQFVDTINEWNPVPEVGPIRSSNPCSEVFLPDNSSCNLCSVRVTKFLKNDGSFDVMAYQHVVRTMITAQDIIVEGSDYPTKAVLDNTHKFHALGIGVTDLGTLLMEKGYAYDSIEGRAYASGLVALLTAMGFQQSLKLAERVGAYESFDAERMSKIIGRHNFTAHLDASTSEMQLAHQLFLDVWNQLRKGATLRNAAISCAMPSGTVSFLLDAATTGIEPELALVKTKSMVGGGTMKLTNQTVGKALKSLGYTAQEIVELKLYIETHGSLSGAPLLRPADARVFDCAMEISPLGHMRMVSALQPFFSMGQSKTVSLPKNATTEDIKSALIYGWENGLKCVSIYRDGSKGIQPLQLTKNTDAVAVQSTLEKYIALLPSVKLLQDRQRMPDTREAITHKFTIDQHKGYITVGLYKDGRPGEIFIHMAKQGSTIAGLIDGFATVVSFALQYGVPLEVLIAKMAHTKFEPSGWTQNPEIRIAKSILDYIFRWMASQFMPQEIAEQYGVHFEGTAELTPQEQEIASDLELRTQPTEGQICAKCGALMLRRAGTCYYCDDCNSSSGGCG